MKNEPVIVESAYNVSIEEVWKALTDKDQMKQWYFDLKEFKPEVGFEFKFEGGKDNRIYTHLCRITYVTINKMLRHTWTYVGFEGQSFVTFELTQEGANTKLKLTHDGLDTFPADNPDFAKNNFLDGWDYIIGTSLKEFLSK
jgi:uncharacterized protein YndB with AHSA1/START domain